MDRETLLELFDYDPQTGTLRHGLRRPPRFRRGEIATRKDSHGYLNVSVRGQSHKAHRIVWFLERGEWPQDELDHINGKRDDNRIGNLRAATHLENSQNRTAQANNKSGFLGVSWKASRGKWRAQITADGKKHMLGYFDTAEDASRAYLEAKERLHGFQPAPRNMGRVVGNES
jgi:hypothetical protein